MAVRLDRESERTEIFHLMNVNSDHHRHRPRRRRRRRCFPQREFISNAWYARRGKKITTRVVVLAPLRTMDSGEEQREDQNERAREREREKERGEREGSKGASEMADKMRSERCGVQGRSCIRSAPVSKGTVPRNCRRALRLRAQWTILLLARNDVAFVLPRIRRASCEDPVLRKMRYEYAEFRATKAARMTEIMKTSKSTRSEMSM